MEKFSNARREISKKIVEKAFKMIMVKLYGMKNMKNG